MKNLIGIFLVISNFFGIYFPVKQYSHQGVWYIKLYVGIKIVRLNQDKDLSYNM